MEVLTEFFPLLRRPLFPAFSPTMKPGAASPSRSTQSTEQNLAQDEQSYGLPVADHFQSKKPGHQPVPQAHDHETNSGEQDDKQHSEQRKLQYAKNVGAFHFCTSSSLFKELRTFTPITRIHIHTDPCPRMP